jgi:preprotein translocase subunit SecE
MNRQHRRQIQRQGQEAGGTGGDGAPDGPLTDAELVGAAMADAAVEAGDAGRGGNGPAGPRARSGGGAGGDGAGRGASAGSVAPPIRHRVAPRQFLHEVNVELRKVAWPTRAETINYSTVVFVTLAVLMAMIFGLDLVFTKLAGFLFNP